MNFTQNFETTGFDGGEPMILVGGSDLLPFKGLFIINLRVPILNYSNKS
jgi:hypothetical protein